MAFHSFSGRRMVEIYDDAGQFVGCVYPNSDGSNSVHVVSRHVDRVEESRRESVDLPGYLITFKRLPSP
jgi:hypothetical protein